MSTSLRAKLIKMKVGEWVPSRAGSASKQGRVDDREFGRKVLEVGDVVDEQIAREDVLPGELGDDADRQPIRGIGADVSNPASRYLCRQGRR